jgi:hypothetical protein
VFLAGRRPFYVGISNKVIERIRQHLRGRSHFEATLAYRIAERVSRRTNAIVENPNHLYKYEISDDFAGSVESDNVVVNDVLVSGPSEPANSGFS